jgi:hypothetical protein
MEGIMTKKIKELQQGASQLLGPAIVLAAVGLGGVAFNNANNAFKAKDFVGMGANAAGLILVAAGTAYAKRLNQLGRDENSGFLDERWRPTINKDNFVSATKRYKDLRGQSTALTFAPGVVIATAGATALATAAFAPVAVAIGSSAVILAVNSAVGSRKKNLGYNLEDTAWNIVRQHLPPPPNHRGNTDDPAVEAARSFLENIHQL